MYKKLMKSKPGTHQNSTLRVNLNTFNKILKKTIREAKKAYFFIQFSLNKNDHKKTWNTINEALKRNRKEEDLPDYILDEDEKIVGQNNILNKLNSHFATVGKKLAETCNNPTIPFDTFLTTPSQINFEFSQVDQEGVEKVIDSLQSKNSCAADGISSKLLKHLKTVISKPITFIINQCLINGIFPDILKIARVKSLFKKGDVHDPNNYRPISILPSISKIFEKIIQKQIVQYFDENNLFFESQYGFRSNHSTELAVLELVDHVSSSVDRGETPLSIFIDLSKAFDCLNHNILLQKLKYYGFNDISHRLLESYLSNRKQYVASSSLKSKFENIDTGVPQGSILGPLLFLIYMNDFAKCTDHFTMINYADDTALITSLNSPNLSTNNNIINQELKNITKWLLANKLVVNVSKSKAMVFSTKHRQINLPEINLNGERVDIVESFNYLGITLDRFLNWQKHVSVVASKISKIIGILKQLRHYFPPYIMKVIYDSLISCHIKYGLLVWGETDERIAKLQKKAIRVVANTKFNAHTDPLFNRFGILKIHDDKKVQELALLYKIRKGKVPKYFSSGFISATQANHGHQTRNTQLLAYPRFRHEFMRKQLKYSITKTSNESPARYLDKILTHSLKGFITYIKNDIINNYPITCTVTNCYVCGGPANR